MTPSADTHGAALAPAPRQTSMLQLVVVCTTSFVVWAGFGAILPGLPVFLKEQAHASMNLIGVIAAAYYVGTFAFSWLLGRASDTIGRKPMMVMGACLFAVSTLLFVTTTHPGWFTLFRLLEGIGAAAVGPASQAFLADITTDDTRSRAYGWLTTAQFGGLIAGPALAGPLSALGGGGKWGFYAIFLFGSALSALTAVALAITVREPEHARRRRQEKVKRPPYRKLVTKPIAAFILVAATSNFAMGAWEVVWSLWLRRLGASMTYIYWTWIVFSVPMLLSFAGGYLADRYNRFALMFSGYAFSAASWILYGATRNLTLFITVNGLEGIAVAYSYPAKQAFLVQVSPPRWLGAVQGLEGTSMQLAALIGTLTAPFMYQVLGGYVISMGGVLAIIGLAIAAPVLRREWASISASRTALQGAEADALAVADRSAAAEPPLEVE